MEVIQIKPTDIVGALPALLQYIFPGFVGMSIYTKITGTKQDNSTLWVMSGVLSYISVVIVANYVDPNANALGAGLLCILFNVAGAIVLGYLRNTVWVRDYCAEHLHVTTANGTISQFVDWEEGSNVAVYLKGDDQHFFVGHVRTVGDGSGDGRLCIYQPRRYAPDGELLYSHEGEDVYMIFSLSDVHYLKLQN